MRKLLGGRKDPEKAKRQRAKTAGAVVDAGFRPPNLSEITALRANLSPRGEQAARTFAFAEEQAKKQQQQPVGVQIDFRAVLKKSKSNPNLEERKINVKPKAQDNKDNSGKLDWRANLKTRSHSPSSPVSPRTSSMKEKSTSPSNDKVRHKLITNWELLLNKKDEYTTDLHMLCTNTNNLLYELVSMNELKNDAQNCELLDRQLNEIKTSLLASLKQQQNTVRGLNVAIKSLISKHKLLQEERIRKEKDTAKQQELEKQKELKRIELEKAKMKREHEELERKRKELMKKEQEEQIKQLKISQAQQNAGIAVKKASSTPVPPPPAAPQAMWIANFDYAGGYRQDAELKFKKGDRIVSTMSQEGWLFGFVEGSPNSSGWFPNNYVSST